MPTIDSGWLDQYQRFPPPGPEPPQEQAKQPVTRAKALIRTRENAELVAQGQSLEQEVSTRRPSRSDRSTRPDDGSHRFVECRPATLTSIYFWPDAILASHKFTRRLVGVGVHRGAVNGADVCRMFNAAIHGRGAPRHLSTDHDPLFEAHRWTANLRILEIDEIKTVPQVPLSHPFVERLIGTVRREFLDHVLFWNARDLERKLADFQVYDNAARSHASLEGHTPLTFVGGRTVARAELNNVRWVSHCRDLVQLPVAA
jgi:hypothetical protein